MCPVNELTVEYVQWAVIPLMCNVLAVIFHFHFHSIAIIIFTNFKFLVSVLVMLRYSRAQTRVNKDGKQSL